MLKYPGCLASLAAGLMLSLASMAAELADSSRVDWHRGVRITLRDGVRLSAMLYRPKGQTAAAPCIVTLTPYIAQSYHDRGVYFAAHGYPFLSVDVRGRGDSEGVFRPNANEATDGFDVVEWLAQQPYCNGKVAMWGGSYAGSNQWAAAKGRPPPLATIVPVAAPYLSADFPTQGNISSPYLMQWLTLVSGRVSHEAVAGDRMFWRSRFRDWFESGRPLRQFDTMLGNPSSQFQEWLAHPSPDAYWDALNPAATEYAQLTIPILTVTGAYDGDQIGALTHYREYMRNSSPAGRARHYLVIGPWDHSGTRTPEAEVGGVTFGPASLVDLPQLHLDWYAWTMSNGPKPAFLEKPVAYYVAGAERWRYADTLEAVTAHSRPYWLDSSGSASDVFASGTLATARPSRAGIDRYVYDPRDLSSALIESAVGPASLVAQDLVLAGSGKQVVYHSPPFERDTEVSGFFRLQAWIGIDQPDTDFLATVYEITADGRSVLLTSTMRRARYRENLREAKLVTTQRPLLYDFNDFPFISRQVARGSRLRLLITAPNSMFLEKNYNSGGPVAAESMADARTVTVSIYHDGARPTVLYAPIGH